MPTALAIALSAALSTTRPAYICVKRYSSVMFLKRNRVGSTEVAYSWPHTSFSLDHIRTKGGKLCGSNYQNFRRQFKGGYCKWDDNGEMNWSNCATVSAGAVLYAYNYPTRYQSNAGPKHSAVDTVRIWWVQDSDNDMFLVAMMDKADAANADGGTVVLKLDSGGTLTNAALQARGFTTVHRRWRWPNDKSETFPTYVVQDDVGGGNVFAWDGASGTGTTTNSWFAGESDGWVLGPFPSTDFSLTMQLVEAKGITKFEFMEYKEHDGEFIGVEIPKLDFILGVTVASAVAADVCASQKSCATCHSLGGKHLKCGWCPTTSTCMDILTEYNPAVKDKDWSVKLSVCGEDWDPFACCSECTAPTTCSTCMAVPGCGWATFADKPNGQCVSGTQPDACTDNHVLWFGIAPTGVCPTPAPTLPPTPNPTPAPTTPAPTTPMPSFSQFLPYTAWDGLLPGAEVTWWDVMPVRPDPMPFNPNPIVASIGLSSAQTLLKLQGSFSWPENKETMLPYNCAQGPGTIRGIEVVIRNFRHGRFGDVTISLQSPLGTSAAVLTGDLCADNHAGGKEFTISKARADQWDRLSDANFGADYHFSGVGGKPMACSGSGQNLRTQHVAVPALSIFKGQNFTGEWRLTLGDTAADNIGFFEAAEVWVWPTVGLPFAIAPTELFSVVYDSTRNFAERTTQLERAKPSAKSREYGQFYNGSLMWLQRSSTDAVNEVQIFTAVPTVGSTAVTGAFTLTFNGVVSTNISISATASVMVRAVEGLGNAGFVEVSRDVMISSPETFRWRVTFITLFGDVSDLVVSSYINGATLIAQELKKGVAPATPATDSIASFTLTVALVWNDHYPMFTWKQQVNVLQHQLGAPSNLQVGMTTPRSAEFSFVPGAFVAASIPSSLQPFYEKNKGAWSPWGQVGKLACKVWMRQRGDNSVWGMWKLFPRAVPFSGTSVQRVDFDNFLSPQTAYEVSPQCIDAWGTQSAPPFDTLQSTGACSAKTIGFETCASGCAECVPKLPGTRCIRCIDELFLNFNTGTCSNESFTKCSLNSFEIGDELDPRIGGTREEQRIRVAGGAADITGTFSLSFMSQTTTLINFDATAADVKKEVEALYPSMSVVVSRSANDVYGYDWVVTFMSNSGDQPLMVVASSDLTGTGPPTCEVSEVVVGVGGPFVKGCTSCGSCPRGTQRSGCKGFSKGNCDECKAGTYKDAVGTFATKCMPCTACVANNFVVRTCTATRNTICASCPAQSTSSPGATSKFACTCANGYFMRDDACVACPAGCERCSGTTCLKCTAPSVLFDPTSATPCVSTCGADHFVDQDPHEVGVFHCTPCAACGKGMERMGCGGVAGMAGMCSACVAGTFKSLAGHANTSCVSCSYVSKSHVVATGVVRPPTPPTGRYLSSECSAVADAVTTPCAPCEIGTFRAQCGDASAGSCVQCQNGVSFKSKIGSATEPCTPCFDCGVDLYASTACTPTSDAGECLLCKRCVNGQFRLRECAGRNSNLSSISNTICGICEGCSAGMQRVDCSPVGFVEGSCVPCEAGLFSEGGIYDNRCTPCDPCHEKPAVFIQRTCTAATDRLCGDCSGGCLSCTSATSCDLCKSPLLIAADGSSCVGECEKGQFEFTAAGAAAALRCKTCTACDPSFEVEVTACSVTSDAYCDVMNVTVPLALKRAGCPECEQEKVQAVTISLGTVLALMIVLFIALIAVAVATASVLHRRAQRNDFENAYEIDAGVLAQIGIGAAAPAPELHSETEVTEESAELVVEEEPATAPVTVLGIGRGGFAEMLAGGFAGGFAVPLEEEGKEQPVAPREDDDGDYGFAQEADAEEGGELAASLPVPAAKRGGRRGSFVEWEDALDAF